MRYLIAMFLIGCASAKQGEVKVSTRSGQCQKSFTEDIDKNTFQVIYFCGAEGNVVIEVTEK